MSIDSETVDKFEAMLRSEVVDEASRRDNLKTIALYGEILTEFTAYVREEAGDRDPLAKAEKAFKEMKGLVYGPEDEAS